MWAFTSAPAGSDYPHSGSGHYLAAQFRHLSQAAPGGPELNKMIAQNAGHGGNTLVARAAGDSQRRQSSPATIAG